MYPINGIAAVYVDNHYEVKNGVISKYYFAGSTRLAVRTIGSSSVATNASDVAREVARRNTNMAFSKSGVPVQHGIINRKERKDREV